MNDTNVKLRSASEPSGRFVLRIDPGLHAHLRDAARQSGVSLNEYCANKLALADTPIGPASELVKRATSLFGEYLVGLLAFGSWARDELAEGSDVDVLVVLDSSVTLTRDLYRAWDAEPLRWNTRPIEVHILRLPPSGARLSGVWAEAAVDGVVLYDRDLSLSRRLVEIRRRIVAGEMVRRQAHGQPYWVEVQDAADHPAKRAAASSSARDTPQPHHTASSIF